MIFTGKIKNFTQLITIKDSEGKTIKKTKVISPTLKHMPSDYFYDKNNEIVKQDRKSTARALLKNYMYKEVILEKGDNFKESIKRIMSFKLHGLYIVRNEKRQVLDYVFIDRQYSFNKYNSLKMNEGIVKGHKSYNAPRKVKLRMALGRERLVRFNCMAMGVKI